ncbi:SusC/RagA family TonB-linked outer membrane protein [Fulvitalea axinellae]|uniref:SusC/RagA family TonB-linked outer membrane protein n=1 Tax=Fulvitalea axinellae TaxID=1182444 RepID=A0AAU9CM04_9BACT|nr:SusC/RagA family TonB-linked outer membrane protein [Fulvitalea axinellae]
MRKLLLFCLAGLMTLTTTFGQENEKTITGNVSGADDKEPIPGVNVTLKGTTIGTVTDIDGNYSLTIPVTKGGTLTFSFIGLATEEVRIGTQKVIDMQMTAELTQLQEVVITGYSQQSKEKLISTIEVLSPTEIEDKPAADVSQLLQGRAAGVVSTIGSGQPGAKTDLIIRGASSISGNNSPLYVIDGIIVENSNQSTITDTEQSPLSQINPDDIESISILKDASATALYGSRGANGVVVITTKKGKAGQTRFGFSGQWGQTVRNKGGFKVMDAFELWTYERAVLEINGYDPDVLRPKSYLTENGDTDWLEEAYQKGQLQRYELSASGGSEHTTYFASLGYYDQSGILIGSDFERYSGRLNINSQLSSTLNMSLNTSLSVADQRNAGNGNTFTSPLLGSWLNRPFDRAYTNGVPTPAGIIGSGVDWQSLSSSNFVREINLRKLTNKTVRSINKFSLSWSPLEDLTLTTNNGYDYLTIKQISYAAPNSYDGQNVKGFLTNVNNINYTLTTSNLINYNYLINDNQELTFLLGFEAQKNVRENFDATGNSVAHPNLRTLDSYARPAGVGGFNTEYFFISYFAQVNYDLLGKYFATGSFRRDGSSRFGSDNRYANFWSVGVSWLMHEEEFISKLDFINTLKIRASTGETGNANIGNFESQALWSGNASYMDNPALVPIQLANPELTWERNTDFNAGIDLGFFERISLSYDFYIRKSKETLLSRPIPATTGYTDVNQNIGSIRNTGHEIILNTKNLTGPITWNTSFNISFNKNEVVDLPGGEPFSNPFTSLQRVEEGHDVRSFYMQKWAGVDRDNGDPLWYKADGTTTNNYNEAARMFVGSATPDFTGGLNNTLAYKGFTFSFFFYFTYGNDVYNSTSRYYDSSGSRFGAVNQTTEAIDFWREDNKGAPRPKPRLSQNTSSLNSSRYLEDGSYIRLRDVTLGYEFDKELIGKIGLNSARVYFQGQNLLTITDYNGIDPEVGVIGTEFFRYPVGKSWSFGLDIRF